MTACRTRSTSWRGTITELDTPQTAGTTGANGATTGTTVLQSVAAPAASGIVGLATKIYFFYQARSAVKIAAERHAQPRQRQQRPHAGHSRRRQKHHAGKARISRPRTEASPPRNHNSAVTKTTSTAAVQRPSRRWGGELYNPPPQRLSPP